MNPEKFRKKSREDKQNYVKRRAELNSLNPIDWSDPINFLFVGVPLFAKKGIK
jgi:hypothetical protein